MTETRTDSGDAWDASWQGAREQLLKATLAATSAQRLAWLEEVLELAHRAGALGRQSPPDGTDSVSDVTPR